MLIMDRNSVLKCKWQWYMKWINMLSYIDIRSWATDSLTRKKGAFCYVWRKKYILDSQWYCLLCTFDLWCQCILLMLGKKTPFAKQGHDTFSTCPALRNHWCRNDKTLSQCLLQNTKLKILYISSISEMMLASNWKKKSDPNHIWAILLLNGSGYSIIIVDICCWYYSTHTNSC